MRLNVEILRLYININPSTFKRDDSFLPIETLKKGVV